MSSNSQSSSLNLPNIITLVRMFLILPFLFLVVRGRVFLAFLVFLAAGLTDVLDGQLARILHKKTRIGSLLDPAADKLLMTSAYIALSIRSLNEPNTIPLWLTGTVIGRDVLLGLGYIVISRWKGSIAVIPTLTGKASTLFQVATILLVLLSNYLHSSPWVLSWVFWATAALTILAGVHYSIAYVIKKPPTYSSSRE